jgi:hypothetical protein
MALSKLELIHLEEVLEQCHELACTDDVGAYKLADQIYDCLLMINRELNESKTPSNS